MCGIRVIFPTLEVLISPIDTSLMITTIKMHEKDMWGIANCSADLHNSREFFMHFVVKIIEIDSYSRRKLTQNQELSMKVIVLRQKAIKSGFHLNFLITIIKHPSKNMMFWRYSYSQKPKQIELSRILQFIQICSIVPVFLYFLWKHRDS